MSAAFTVRIRLTGAINGTTALPAAAALTITLSSTADTITIDDVGGGPIVGDVGRISLSLLEGILGFPSGLVTSLMVVDAGATTGAAASGPIGQTQRWSPVRTFSPNAGGNAFLPNTIPLLSASDFLIVSTNSAGGAGREIIFQVVPAAAKEVMEMCAAGFLFAPDTGNPLIIQQTGWLPPTSESVPITAAQALVIGSNNIYNTAAGAVGVTVAAATEGAIFGVKNIPGGSANALTITPAAGTIENIAGAAGATAAIASATAALVYVGTDAGNWILASRS